MKRLLSFFIAVNILLSGFGTFAVSAEGNAPSAGDVDLLVFGNEDSERAHGLKITGGSEIMQAHEDVGEIDKMHTVRKVEEYSSIEFDMSILSGKSLSLELEEIHQMRQIVFAYNIYVNGEKVYFRNYRETASGANNFFVRVPEEITKGKDSAHIRIENISGEYFTLKRIWAYSDWDNILLEEGAFQKLKLLTLQSGDAFPRMEQDREALKQKIAKRKETFGTDYTSYQMGMGGELFYVRNGDKEDKRIIEDLVNIAYDENVPLALGINSWWEGTPMWVYDGEGGYFNDIEYGQVIFDPDEVEKKGKFLPTTPNMWGNTPWLSMNNPSLNRARYGWYEKNLRNVSKSLAKVRLENNNESPYFSLYTENEPIYWIYYAHNAAPNSRGDLNPYAVADAKKDGVDLNPLDGFSKEESQWQFDNINRNFADTARALKKGVGYDYVVVDNGKVMYPERQLFDESFTHIVSYKGLSDYAPGVDRGMWEAGVTEDINLGLQTTFVLGGGEMTEDTASGMDYIASKGKFAQVNGESSLNSVSGADSGVKLYYTYGAEYYTDYNTKPENVEIIKQIDKCEDETIDVVSYENRLFTYDFQDGIDVKPGSPLVEVTNGMSGQSWRNKSLQTTGSEKATTAVFKVDNKGTPLSTGLTVDVYGGAENAIVEVWGGPTRDNMQLVGSYDYYRCGSKFDLSDVIDKTSDVAYYMFKMQANAGGFANLVKTSAMIPWEEKAGHTDGFLYNRKQLRERYTFLTARVELEAMMEEYLAKNGQDSHYSEIEDLYQKGRYISAKKKMVAYISEVLPAKYLVKGNGQLGKYPITITGEKPENVYDILLTEYGNSVSFEVTAEQAGKANVVLEVPEGYYTVSFADNTFRAVKSDSCNSVAKFAEGGRLEAEISVCSDQQAEPVFDRKFNALATNFKQGLLPDVLYVSMLDTERYGFADGFPFQIADDAVFRRGPAGGEPEQLALTKENLLQIQKGEYLTVELNEADEITSLTAVYGKVHGTVTKVEEPSLYPEIKPAFIELLSDDGQNLRFELNSNADLSNCFNANGKNLLFLPYNKGLGLSEGETVTVEYIPEKLGGKYGDSYYALKVSDDINILKVSNDFENSSMKPYDTAVNVTVKNLDANNPWKCAVTQSGPGVGELVWEIKHDKPIKEVGIKFTGRAILGSKIEWVLSSNGYNFRKVGEYETTDNVFQGFLIENRTLLNAPKYMGKNTLYVGCRLNCKSDTWAALNSVQIYIKD